jgi:hypothetical protein
MRALARGDDPQDVVTVIAAYRPDKPKPKYYAEYTVQKALTALGSRARIDVPTSETMPEH